MKKLFLPILLTVCLSVFSSPVSSEASCMLPDETMMVSFSDQTPFNEAQKDRISHLLICGSAHNDAQPVSLACIFGHNIITDTVVLTHHRVRDIAPRCDDLYYQFDMCNRCDYTNYTLLYTMPVHCHAEE